MAIKVNNTTVITDARQLANVASLDSTTIAAINANISSGAALQSSAPTAANGGLWINTNDYYLYVYNGTSWKNTYTYCGEGNPSSGGHLYTHNTFVNHDYAQPDTTTHTFVVPPTIINISVVCIGCGANEGSFSYIQHTGGNGGGGLCYKNNIAVTPGDTFDITLSPTYARFYKSGTCDVRALGANQKSGGGRSGGDGGGNGGNGGTSYSQNHAGGGSGGAGGYSGNGGVGGNGDRQTRNGSAGSGGGAGGGGNMWSSDNFGYFGGAAGGGTSPFGYNNNSGAGGTGDTISDHNNNATAGANGSGPTSSQITNAPSEGNIPKLFYGAGMPGAYMPRNNLGGLNSRTVMEGCVRVVWAVGSTQAFPATNVSRNANEGYN
jgi:hypothetical protein